MGALCTNLELGKVIEGYTMILVGIVHRSVLVSVWVRIGCRLIVMKLDIGGRDIEASAVDLLPTLASKRHRRNIVELDALISVDITDGLVVSQNVCHVAWMVC